LLPKSIFAAISSRTASFLRSLFRLLLYLILSGIASEPFQLKSPSATFQLIAVKSPALLECGSNGLYKLSTIIARAGLTSLL